MLHSIKIAVVFILVFMSALFLVAFIAGATNGEEYEQSLCDELQSLAKDPGPCECITYWTQEGHVAIKVVCETKTYAGMQINSY